MATTAPAAIIAGTLSAAGEALHKLPPAVARPFWIEPIRPAASDAGHAAAQLLELPTTPDDDRRE
jgi:hypothetical protein